MSTVVIVIIVIAVIALLGLLAMSLSGRNRRPGRPVAAASPAHGDEVLEPRSHAEAARSDVRS